MMSQTLMMTKKWKDENLTTLLTVYLQKFIIFADVNKKFIFLKTLSFQFNEPMIVIGCAKFQKMKNVKKETINYRKIRLFLLLSAKILFF